MIGGDEALHDVDVIDARSPRQEQVVAGASVT